MDMQVIEQDNATVIVPTLRRLDAAVAPAFKQDVVARVQAGATRLVVDLEQVEFVDSSGLGALVSILKSLGGRGAVAVCNVKGPVLNLFKLTRMDKVFTIAGTRAEAVARLGA
ncbi:STAS domain-containing protein [Ramlibacter albus]|uniref:Anti-sigma factor antagonist n=1 Tax=Ramlibacter albus TaxID=2079448 RepID=A0A923M7G4_9BURK|nr:STAS domain-containing protein [Ramlibacter albus]MBC5764216.1 STAS domain-containing protein [Ramlibacter albus]